MPETNADLPHWERTIGALCTELEQYRMLLAAATVRAGAEKSRADEAEAFIVNFMALAPFARLRKHNVLDIRNPESTHSAPLSRKRPVDLWPVPRRSATSGTSHRVPRQRSPNEMD